MRKLFKHKRAIAVMLVSIVLVCFMLLPIGAVSVQPYFNDRPASINTKLSDMMYNTSLHCNIGYMYDLTSGALQANAPNNLILSMPSQRTMYGARYDANSGDTVSPVILSHYVEQVNSAIYDEYDTNKFSAVSFKDLDTVAYEQYDLAILNREGELDKYYRGLAVHTVSLIGVRNNITSQPTGGGIFPYGFLLNAQDLILVPALVEAYTSPTILGYNSFDGTIRSNEGIGGILLRVPGRTNQYSGLKIRYNITYYNVYGVKGTYTTTYDANDWWNSYGDKLRIPLIPIEFLEGHRGEDIIYIENVDVNMMGNVAYVDDDQRLCYFYAIDTTMLTNDGTIYPDEIPSFKFDRDLESDVLGAYMRYFVNDGYNPEWGELTGWLGNAVSGVMDMEFGFGITLGGILSVCLAFGCVMLYLKYFAGG